MIKLSVIVPVYKVEPYINKCIDSILTQTFIDFELILINDGSPDNSGQICDEYAKKDNRVRVIHKVNGGVSAARNLGVSVAKGKYISFVDSDDYIENNMYEIMITILEKTKADMVKCSIGEFKDSCILKTIKFNDKVKIIDNNDEKTDLMQLYFGGVLYTSPVNAIYTKELACKVFFPEDFIAEDNYSSGMYLYYANKVIAIDDVLYFYRKHDYGVNHAASVERPINFVLATAKLHEDLRSSGLMNEEFYLKLRKKIARHVYHCARKKNYLTISEGFYEFTMKHLDFRRQFLFLFYKSMNYFSIK